MKLDWKLKWLVLVLLVAGILAGGAEGVLARSYSADRFDVLVEVQPNGSFYVTETIAFRFVGGPYTFAKREIKLNELDVLTFIEAQQNGMPMEAGTAAGQVEVTSGDPTIVTWHFDPVSDAVVTTTLRYFVVGNVRPTADGDLLYWQAIPAEHEYDIEHSTITVMYPPELTLAGTPVLENQSGVLSESPGMVSWEIGAISADQYASIKTAFPSGSLVSEPPQWQAKQLLVRQRTLDALPWTILLALGIGGVAALFSRLAWAGSREPQADKIPLGIVNRPPGDQPPALVSALLGGGTASFPSTTGALLSLAERGYVEIRETGKKGMFGGRDFVFVQTRQDLTELMEHERLILKTLFEPARGRREEVRITELGLDLSRAWKIISKTLVDELTTQGLLQPERLKQRTMMQRLGIALLVPPFLLFWVIFLFIFNPSLTWHGMIALGILAGLGLAGVVVLIYSSRWNTLTARGKTLQDRWAAFQKYLREQTRAREPLQPSWLEEFLAFAVTFELGDQWVRAFDRQGVRALPEWLKPLKALDDSTLMNFIGTASSTGGGSSSSGGGGGGGSSSAG